MNDGPPKVICSVCREQVLKSQTCRVGKDERACKSHEGVTEKAQKLFKYEKEKLEINAKFKAVKAEREMQYQYFSGKTVNSCIGELNIDDCWICGKEGILSKTLQVVQDAAMSRLKLNGIAPNTSSEDFVTQMEGMDVIKKESGINGDFKSVSIIYLDILNAKKQELVKLVIKQKYNLAFDKVWGGLVIICQECATQLKIEASK